MKKIAQIILVIVLFTFKTISLKSQTYTIYGTVKQTYAYCGGTKPTEEILNKLTTPRPFPNKTFYIRRGKQNNIHTKVLKKITSDSAGNFSVKLPKGTYSILLEEQVNIKSANDYLGKNQSISDSCFQAWWRKPYYLLKVTKNNNPLYFIFHHRCHIKSDIPCISYIGPERP